ncbi:MAG: hypothetical protein QXP01_00575 [Candidatus Hadarchaeum sp.]
MTYEYKMVQIPPTIKVKGAATGQEAAVYLQDLANQMAADGWEFYRVDTVGVVIAPGCLGSLLGKREELVHYFVVTFRRPVQSNKMKS